MRVYLLDFLKELERLIPPPVNCHHAITYAQYGSDQTGWTDQIAVQVNRRGKFHCFFLDEADFKCSPPKLAARIASALSEPKPDEQLGVGLGQYKA